MKFCLKQKIVTNPPPTDKIEKVSGVTEYEALRAEKLFRYEYSNQLNTSLLTFAFTVFTAGLIIFTLLFEFGEIFKSTENNIAGDQTYLVFAEYFFACFFLLPCFFSRINFRYTLKNSLRIGQLTDYTREKIKFDDDESWESFKRDYHVNYFYQKPSGVGGAKDIPQWINIISCGLSLAVGLIGIYSIVNKNNIFDSISWVWIVFVVIFGIMLIAKISEQLWYPKTFSLLTKVITIIEIVIVVVGVLCNCTDIEPSTLIQAITVVLWAIVFQVCVLITPQYNREIELANCILDYSRAKLRERNNKPKNEIVEARNERIFIEFLQNSTVVNNYKQKLKRRKVLKWVQLKKYNAVLHQIDMNNRDLSRTKKNDCINNYFNVQSEKRRKVMKNKPFNNYEITPYETFEQLLAIVKSKYGDKVLFRTRRRKSESAVTYNQFYDDVQKLAWYFSKTYGARNKIAVIGENSYEWILTYFAVVCSNNIIVPIDKELSAPNIAELLKECECHTLIYSKDYDDIADDISGIIPDFEAIAMPKLRGMIEAVETAEWIETDKNALASIIYTSGTTGKSKGVMLSQKNICEDTRAACGFIELYGRSLALLPFHHTFAFTVSGLANIYYGVDTLIVPSLKNVMELINDFKPTYLAVVPMIVEKVDKGILQKIEKSGKKKLLGVLDKVCKPFDALGIGLRNKCFSAIRNGLGGELDFIISGGAPIDQQIIDRFDSYGIRIMNGYGISECSPVVSVNRRYHYRAGSIGQALPEVKVKIDNPDENGEGEICVQGDIVMLGYYNMPEETEKAIIDGWFHTGDLGKLDKDGFIYITGRIKNLIILSNGKNVSPEELETLIGRIPGVVECLVSEEDNKLVAEIYPDEEFRATQSDIQAYFDEQIDQLNDTLPPYKAIAKVTIRDTEFVKTTTKKIKRTYKK